MSLVRGRLPAVLAAGLALLAGVLQVGCDRSATPAVTATQPRPNDSDEATESETRELPVAAEAAPQRDEMGMTPPDDRAADSGAPVIEMDVPEQPEPKLPRYVSIVEQIDSARRAQVQATIDGSRKLELTTENVKRLRLTREGLPLTRNLSIVLRIDGQGIEWTPKYLAVELERSPAGAWTVVRRRPVNP